MPATAPASTKPDSLVRTGGTDMAAAAFSLSRVASSTRPERARRSPWTNRIVSTRKPRQRK